MSSPASWRDRVALGLCALAGACGGGGAEGDGGSVATDPMTVGDPTTAPTTDVAESGSTAVEPTDDDGPLPPPDCVAPQIACGQTCADLDVDPTNCGACGTSCIVDNGAAACADGVCALGSCDVGFADCDGTLATGCEHVVDCDPGSGCTTTCGSTGVVGCGDPCVPTCAAPAETCNALDDDCDGVCDQGPLPGCRVGVHRAIGGIGHFYTANLAEVANLGLTMEIQDFFFVYPEPVDGLIPLFRCIKPNAGGRRFLTSSIDCETTGAPELTLGFISPDDRCGSTPLYRVYAPGSDDHFYTTSAAERDNAIAMFGYQDQGSPGFVFGGL